VGFKPLGFEVVKVGMLGLADDLQSLAGEVTGVAGQGQAGPVDGRLADDALEAGGAGQEAQFQGAGLFVVKLFDGDGSALHTNLEVKFRAEINLAALGSLGISAPMPE